MKPVRFENHQRRVGAPVVLSRAMRQVADVGELAVRAALILKKTHHGEDVVPEFLSAERERHECANDHLHRMGKWRASGWEACAEIGDELGVAGVVVGVLLHVYAEDGEPRIESKHRGAAVHISAMDDSSTDEGDILIVCTSGGDKGFERHGWEERAHDCPA